MKKILILSVIMISLVAVRLNVNAAATNADPGDDNYSTLQSNYSNGITTTNVNGNDWVTVYGKAVCNGTTCSISYANSLNLEKVLSKSGNCANGEKYINYTLGSTGNSPYVEEGEKISGTGYFSEEYYVTCTSDNGNGSVQLENQVSNNTNVGTNDGTVDNPQTGVNTYFVVLGIVAIISYSFMLLTKKFNLFKKI